MREAKVHLLFTALVTEKRRFHHKGTLEIPNRDRVSIFLTTLESLRHLPIQSADFYLEFDETTVWAKKLVLNYLEILPFEFILHERRLDNYSRWLSSTKSKKLIEADQIMLLTYDDHLFLRTSLFELNNILTAHLSLVKKYGNSKFLVLLSHYPETHGLISFAKAAKKLIIIDGLYLIPVVTPIGAIVLDPKEYISWFNSDFTKGDKFVGPENPFGSSILLDDAYYIVPRAEIFRHLDAYAHVNLLGWPYQVMDSTIKISTQESKPSLVNEKWTYQFNIKKPVINVHKTLLIDSMTEGDKVGFKVAILKACSIRFSLESVKIINSIYKLKKSEIFFNLIYNFLYIKQFRVAVYRYFYEMPLHLVFKTSLPLHRNLTVSNKKYFSILILATLTGRVKTFKQIFSQSYRRRRS